MRKYRYILILTFGCIAKLMAQTIVSTELESRKLVLEEFGGIYCLYCPDGNEIAATILSQYEEDVFVINIHGGPWAEPEAGFPDYRTEYADAFIETSGLNGFPAGMVNRLNFPGLEQDGVPGIAAMSRWYWEEAIGEALYSPAIVNVAATAIIDYASNEMEVYVEVYYTGDSEMSTNYLNIAVLQNNIHGPQVGGSQEGNYLHQHLLRDMLTGQWGVPITTTTSGHFESRTFTYPLPTDINNVPLDWANIALVVTVNESHLNVLNATGMKPDYIVESAIDANALFLEISNVICGDEITPVFTLRNDGNEVLNSILIEYRINEGIPQAYEWTGILNTFESEVITLPSLVIDDLIETNNCLSLHIYPLNGEADENAQNDTLCSLFELPPSSETPTVKFELKTDEFGYDIYWDIKDEENNIVASGGNEMVGENGGGTQMGTPDDPGAYGNNENISVEIYLPDEGCYTFRILDDYGDGLCCQNGIGFFYLEDGNGSLVFTGGEFLVEKVISFSFGNGVTAVGEKTQAPLELFPNPVNNGRLYYELSSNETELLKVELYNANARILYQATESVFASKVYQGNIDVQTFPSGIYFLKLTTAKGSVSKRVVIMNE